ncbi:hypothetical protein ACIQU2_27425 [Pseudomonas sp. NPDC098740]|uniref:hypothetical protein n=1 Tax=Pseudomonas sp. NPDC098740 TaxID=3364486 RepID=UPI00383AE201
MAAKKAKNMTLGHAQGMEARAMQLIGRVEQVQTAEELEEAGQYVKWVVEMMVEEGYHPIAAEGFAMHGRRAVAAAQVRLGVSADGVAQPGANARGLHAGHFKSRLKNMVAILSNYTPAEFARECARLARSADPRVLQEDEFQ